MAGAAPPDSEMGWITATVVVNHYELFEKGEGEEDAIIPRVQIYSIPFEDSEA